MKIALDKLVTLLDNTLMTEQFADLSNNGLQLANQGMVERVITGVDASLPLLQHAAEQGANCVVCHHGISWGDSLKRITNINYKIIAFAIQHDIAIYGSHLPLDAHLKYGNNAQLAALLGLEEVEPAFRYRGECIGITGRYTQPMDISQFCELAGQRINPEFKCFAFGRPAITRVGIVSGGAGDMVEQVALAGMDLFLSGEPTLQAYNLAEHWGMNAVFAGHYATEKWGVKALAELITDQLQIPADFVDFKIPY